MATQIQLRPATRADLPTLSHIANAANAHSLLHNRIAPFQTTHPASYFHWRHLATRQRFVRPDLRFVVAIDASTGAILGFGTYAAEGQSPLLARWTREADALQNRLERALLRVEEAYARYISDRSVDWTWLGEFHAQAAQKRSSERPACLHLWLLCVDPGMQKAGVGRALVDWGRKVAGEEGLPLVLESNLEAVGFYERIGFRRMSEEMVVFEGKVGEEFRIPMFAWEGEGREGTWLEEDSRGLWKWKVDVLS